MSANRFAFLMGIRQYTHIASLTTPVNDVKAIGKVLEDKYGFEVNILEDLDLKSMKKLFEKTIPKAVEGKDDCQLLIYFAGHGYAQPNDKNWVGYFIPANATSGEKETWYSMQDFYQALENLNVLHLLLVLDCCFGGAFRFAEKNRGLVLKVEKLYRQHYDYFTKHHSWQVLSSTAPDQLAMDFLDWAEEETHSPFADLFLEAISGKARNDEEGIITCLDLFDYIRKQLPERTKNNTAQRAGYFTLDPHKNGEFLFVPKTFKLGSLSESLLDNPYKALRAL